MQVVAPGLFVGSQTDWEGLPEDHGMAVVHAAKEPFHRQALGYAGRGAPKDDPEYLFARRGDRLIMNLVDVADPAYVSRELIDAAVEFIAEQRADGRQVLCHCNQGRSRSPTIAMLVMAKSLPAKFEDAEEAFREIYPAYEPANGMREFARMNWDDYRGASK